jgi:hypothetical protein
MTTFRWLPGSPRPFSPPPSIATAPPTPHRLLAQLSHQYRLLAERAAVGWQTYRDGAAIDPGIAADWQQPSDLRRQAFHALIARVPAAALRPGLTNAAAADTAWVIASPDTHEQLVPPGGLHLRKLGPRHPPVRHLTPLPARNPTMRPVS